MISSRIDMNMPYPTGMPYICSGTVISLPRIHRTGVAVVDDQHLCLAGTINTLFHYMRANQGKQVAAPILSIFKQYMKIHFRTELSFLLFSGYPHMDLFELQYHEMREQLALAEQSFRRTGDAAGLLDFLKHWWHMHMKWQDSLFINCLANRGGFH